MSSEGIEEGMTAWREVKMRQESSEADDVEESESKHITLENGMEVI